MENTKKKKLKFSNLFSILVISSIVLCGIGGHWLGQTAYGYDYYYYWSDTTGDTHLGDTPIEMTYPASSYSKYWLAGSDHEVTCTTVATDKDCKFGRNEGEAWEYIGKVTDSITHFWSGTSGMFENDDNIGTAVHYVCRYSEGVDGITCGANDNYSDNNNYFRGQTDGNEGPEGPGGDDGATSDTHYVYVRAPYMEEFTWSGKHNIKDVPEPEYDNSADKNEPACYTKNGSISASDVYFYDAANAAKLTEPSSVDVLACSRTLTSEEILSGDPPDANSIWMNGSGSWRTWSSDKISMSGGGAKLVDYVHKYNGNLPLYWYYKVSTVANPDDKWQACGSSSHTVYSVLSAPTAPQAVPWLAVLDRAVAWAEGKTTEPNALHEITGGLNGCGIDYVGGVRYSSFTNYDDQEFNLTQWLADAPWTNDAGNCSDMGNLVHIYGNAIGASAQYMVKDGVAGNRVPGRFDTNYIDPVGSPGWQQVSWNYHQFGWAGGNVYDASCKVDDDGTPESAPHTALLPTELSEATFKGYVVKSGEDWTTVTGTPSVCTVK